MPRPSASWQVIFQDDFQTGHIDPKNWAYELGNRNGWGNGEKQTYTENSENAYITAEDGNSSNQILNIALRKEKNNKWTSSRIKSIKEFKFGRFDARIKTSTVDGPFCAVWLLPEAKPWPLRGEIDIFEMLSKWNYTPATLHFQERHADNPVSFKNKLKIDEWHVYSVEWTEDSITFLHDETEIGSYKKPPGAKKENWPFDGKNGFNIIMNNAMHPFFGHPPATDLKSHIMQVDYIRVRKYPKDN